MREWPVVRRREAYHLGRLQIETDDGGTRPPVVACATAPRRVTATEGMSRAEKGPFTAIFIARLLDRAR
jgi:hypothetical protein